MAVYLQNQTSIKMNYFDYVVNVLRVQKSAKQIDEVSKLTADQANDESGEWIMLRSGNM